MQTLLPSLKPVPAGFGDDRYDGRRRILSSHERVGLERVRLFCGSTMSGELLETWRRLIARGGLTLTIATAALLSVAMAAHAQQASTPAATGPTPQPDALSADEVIARIRKDFPLMEVSEIKRRIEEMGPKLKPFDLKAAGPADVSSHGKSRLNLFGMSENNGTLLLRYAIDVTVFQSEVEAAGLDWEKFSSVSTAGGLGQERDTRVMRENVGRSFYDGTVIFDWLMDHGYFKESKGWVGTVKHLPAAKTAEFKSWLVEKGYSPGEVNSIQSLLQLQIYFTGSWLKKLEDVRALYGTDAAKVMSLLAGKQRPSVRVFSNGTFDMIAREANGSFLTVDDALFLPDRVLSELHYYDYAGAERPVARAVRDPSRFVFKFIDPVNSPCQKSKNIFI